MTAPTCPLTHREVVDRYFLEHRAKVIDIAAFLDRIDRAAPPEPRADASASEDHRLVAFRATLAILIDGRGDRARRVLESLSDLSLDPIDRAEVQGAFGAPPIRGGIGGDA